MIITVTTNTNIDIMNINATTSIRQQYNVANIICFKL
jgi:hypothetical protein